MEPFLLLELAAGQTYGYELTRVMADLGFRRAAEDPSMLYKVLRVLEEEGYLTSAWSVGEDRPRRLYQLTSQGEVYLHERTVDLERQSKRIAAFQERYRRRYPNREKFTVAEETP